MVIIDDTRLNILCFVLAEIIREGREYAIAVGRLGPIWYDGATIRCASSDSRVNERKRSRNELNNEPVTLQVATSTTGPGIA